MKANDRPDWDTIFIVMAAVLSSRGTCDRLKTASILVKDKRIVGAGYNGAVSGLENCDDVGHLMVENHCVRTLHGEHNAVLNAVADLKGATCYIIGTPCIDCTKVLLQEGITRIVHAGTYSNSKGMEHVRAWCNQKNVVIDLWCPDGKGVLESLGKVLNCLRGPGGIFRDVDFSDWIKLFAKTPAKPEERKPYSGGLEGTGLDPQIISDAHAGE